jgi:demethoxyubiquinone hydroxylase (CLK1/Coq7/Cat5 family)
MANLARAEAAIPLKIELGVEAERSEALETVLETLKVREIAHRLGAVASAARTAALEPTSSSAVAAAAKAAATVGAANGGRNGGAQKGKGR